MPIDCSDGALNDWVNAMNKIERLEEENKRLRAEIDELKARPTLPDIGTERASEVVRLDGPDEEVIRWRDLAPEQEVDPGLLADTIAALEDLHACDDPSCTDPNCLHVLPRLRALRSRLAEPALAAPSEEEAEKLRGSLDEAEWLAKNIPANRISVWDSHIVTLATEVRRLRAALVEMNEIWNSNQEQLNDAYAALASERAKGEGAPLDDGQLRVNAEALADYIRETSMQLSTAQAGNKVVTYKLCHSREEAIAKVLQTLNYPAPDATPGYMTPDEQARYQAHILRGATPVPDATALREAVRQIRRVGAVFMDEGGRPDVAFSLTEGEAAKTLAALLRSEPREGERG